MASNEERRERLIADAKASLSKGSGDYVRGRLEGWLEEIERTQRHVQELTAQLDIAMETLTQLREEKEKTND